MPPIEVDSVRLAEFDRDVLYGRNVDGQKPGEHATNPSLHLVGWVLGKAEPAVAVEIVAADRVVGRVPVEAERPDLALAFPDVQGAGTGGFRAPVTVVDAGPFLDLQVRAVLQDQRRVHLGTIRLKSVAATTATSPDDRVSVIIPCYNQAHYLGDALASVAAQTHGQPEVIVVDDGSTDNTVEVAERCPGVRYVRQDNAGLAAARNTGIRHSTGEYLVFLDADDRLLPSAFRVGLTALAARPGHAFVYGGWRLIGADGAVMPTPEPAQVDDDPYRGLLRMCFISTPAAVMYRRAAVAAGGFDTAVSPSADYDLYLRLTRRWPSYCHGELVAEYRRHGANMTLDRAMMLQAELTVLRRQWPYVRGDPELVDALWEGLHRSQDYHGGKLARDVRAQAATGDWQPAVWGSLRLIRHHPGALMPAGREWADAASDLRVRLRCSALVRAIRGGNDRGEGCENEERAPWVR